MKFQLKRKMLGAGAVLALGLSGCSGGGLNQTVPFPTLTNAYTYAETVAIPGVPPPAPAKFDYGINTISAADGNFYLADRTTGGVDVVNLASRTFLRTAGKGSFSGTVKTPSHASGPNGVAPVGNGIVFAGDGNDDVVVVDANAGTTLAKITIPNATLRVDLLGYDPKDKIVLAISDSSLPWPVGTFISSVAPYAILGQIVFTNATGGVDQATYDPNQGVFFESITATSTNPNGELDEINPVTEQIVKTLPFATQCNPAGTAIGPNDIVAVSCGRDPNTDAPMVSQVINGATGAVVATVPTANGCDQAWYNPGNNRFSFACSHAVIGTASNKNVTIIDASTYALIATIPTGSSSNSAPVDPVTNALFIAQSSSKNALGLNIYTYQ